MLIAAAALLVWPLLAMTLTPATLARRRWPQRFPRLALLAWGVTLTTGVLGVLGSLGAVLMAAREMGQTHTTTSAVSCAQFCHGVVVICAGWTLTAVVGGVGCLALARMVPLVRGRHDARDLVTAACRHARAQEARTGTPGERVRVLQVSSDRAMAASLPGRRPVIMISSSLAEALTPAELRSVIEHERSHLRQRHALLAQTARLTRAIAPALPCARELERSVLLLIELAADDRAARSCGADATASALAKVSALDGDGAMGLRAVRLERRRPARLAPAARVA